MDAGRAEDFLPTRTEVFIILTNTQVGTEQDTKNGESGTFCYADARSREMEQVERKYAGCD